jgi:ornithine carbamoyltransferase
MQAHLSAKESKVVHSLHGRDLLSADDFSKAEILSLLELAEDMKHHPKKFTTALKGKILALIFEKPSLRTRTSFTVAIDQLGGNCVDFPPGDLGFGRHESLYDVAKNLERMVNAVMIRTFAQETIMSFARYASIPVINGLTDHEHPCQAMADFLTIREHNKNFTRLKLAYVGDGNNVSHSLMLMAGKIGATLYVATPEHYEPNPDVVTRAQELASISGGRLVITHDPEEAARDAYVIYTDTWTSMGQESEAQVRHEALKRFQVNKELFAKARRDAMFMHCLPAHRGEEVTNDVIDSPRSVVFEEAENRVHVQKAILYALLK